MAPLSPIYRRQQRDSPLATFLAGGSSGFAFHMKTFAVATCSSGFVCTVREVAVNESFQRLYLGKARMID